MGFFKPADDAEDTDDAPIAGDEGSPEAADEDGTVGFAADEGGDALADPGAEEAQAGGL